LRHKLEVGERRFLASHYTLTTGRMHTIATVKIRIKLSQTERFPNSAREV